MSESGAGSSALVTGGASGLGLAAAEQLAARGYALLLLDMNEETGRDAVHRIESEYPGTVVSFHKCNVTSEEDVMAALRAVLPDRPLRVVVNCAGIGGAVRVVSRSGKPMPLDAFKHVINVNLLGTFNVLRLAAAHMAKNTPPTGADQGRGVVVNVASVAAFDGQIGQAAYSASKGGCVSMTLPIARDLAPLGIRCCTIAPGIFLTPMMQMGGEALMEGLRQDVPFPSRLGDPVEFGKLVAHIVENRYLNGETIRLDGAIRMPPRSRPAKAKL